MRMITYIMIILLTSAICSCRSEKEVIKQVTVARDSVIIRDSVRITDKVNRRDSVILRDSVVTVIDTQGNVVRTELYREREKYKDLERDYMDLQDKALALYHEKNDTTYIEKEKPLTRWESVKMELGGYMIGVIIFLLIFIGILFARRK